MHDATVKRWRDYHLKLLSQNGEREKVAGKEYFIITPLVGLLLCLVIYLKRIIKDEEKSMQDK